MLALRRVIFVIGTLFSLFLTVKCTHTPSEEMDDNPVIKNLNEQIAGNYKGEFQCGYYNGTYGSDNYPGSIKLVAVGNDSLQVAQNAGCIYNTPSFKYDSLVSIGADYTVWRRAGMHEGLWYFKANDSIVVSMPEHFSIGWLGRSFNGIKE